jgi:DNA polymerase I-like protein with 3'-5' exonuclease and polymerase domains
MDTIGQYKLVATHEQAEQVIKEITDSGAVHALDFETTGLRPENSEVRLTCISGPAGNYVIDHLYCRPFPYYANVLADACPWAVFNAGFEGRWFDYVTAGPDVVLFDVGVMSKAKLGGRPLSLADMVKRDLGKTRDNKHLQVSDWSQKELTQEQYDYGFEDAEDTYNLYTMWLAALTAPQMAGFYVLNDAWRGTAEMEDTGMTIDEEHHSGLIDMWTLRRGVAEKVLRKYTPEDLIANLRSKKQISDFLKTVMDETSLRAWPKTAKSEQLQTDRKQLRQASFRSPYPFSRWLAAMMVFNRADKYLGTYGETLLTKQRLAGRVYGRFNIAQAITGRYSSCIPAHVEVLTPTGTKLMGDLQVGDLVISHTFAEQAVTKKLFSGVAQVYRIYLTTGEVLDCTSNHRLLTEFGWRSLEECYGYDLDARAKAADCGAVYCPRQTDDGTGRGGDWVQLQGSAWGSSQSIVEGATADGEAVTLLQKQDWEQKPDEREVRGTAPLLQRSVCRPEGLPDCNQTGLDAGRSTASVSAPCGDVRSAGDSGDTKGLPCASHQRGQAGQQISEFGPRIRRGTRRDTSSYTAIRRIEFVGSAPVYDLEVATDHSFIAGGVVVHNSNPNLQNIPRNPLVRRSFIAPPDTEMVLADYSGIELRVLAEVSNDPQLKQDVIFGDVHAESAITLFRVDPAEFKARLKAKDPRAKEMRSKAKAFSFQLTYGAGNAALAMVLRCSDGEAAEYVDKWAARYPYAYALRFQMFDQMNATGLLPIKSGRTVYVHKNERSLPVASNYPIQGAAADVMYRAVTRMSFKVYELPFKARMLASIHDELLMLAETGRGEELREIMVEEMRQAWLDIFPNAETANLSESAVGQSWAAKP